MKSFEDRQFENRFRNVETPFGIINMFDTLIGKERGFMLVFLHSKHRKLRLGARNAFLLSQVFSFSYINKFMVNFVIHRQYHETE